MSADNTTMCQCKIQIPNNGEIPSNAKVYKDECILCFDHVKSSNGVSVCLTCFYGGCKGALNHAYQHHQRSGHNLFLNIKRVRIEKDVKQVAAEQPKAITKVAIGVEGGAALDESGGTWEDKVQVECFQCNGNVEMSSSDDLKKLVDAVLAADSASSQSAIKSWEHKITECEHTLTLNQDSDAPKLAKKSLAHCAECDLDNNLWLCMTCGHLGCGRKNYDGSGGNNHGVEHWENSHHPLVCKMGTVTAEGTADIFCYACDDAKKDAKLREHFAHFGIDLSTQEKTEKSTGELELEQNLKLQFKSTADEYLGDPVFGPGHTGLINIGNSCYLASVVQNLFALCEFQKYYCLGETADHQSTCSAASPASCWRCQVAKLVDGLFSGRYSKAVTQRYFDHVKETDATGKEVVKVVEKTRTKQEGIAPRMFKALVAGQNVDFAGMQQQDAYEYFQHLVNFIQENERSTSTPDPTHVFSFKMRQRIQCTKCNRVGYQSSDQCELSLGLPTEKAQPPLAPAPADEKREDLIAREKLSFISIYDCFNQAFEPEAIAGWQCPSCKSATVAKKSHAFETTPAVIAVSMRRQVFQDWVPRKVHLSVGMPNEQHIIDLSHLLAKPPPDDETPLPKPEPKHDIDETAVQQLMMMDIPKIRAQRAILATNNTGAEPAMNWLFAHLDDPDIDDPLPPPGADTQANDDGVPAELVSNLVAMLGETVPRIKKALRSNGNDPDQAVGWLFSNPDDKGDVDDGPPPEKPVDKRPPIYQLTGLIEHRGASVHSGHYVAYLRKNGQWIQYNDSSVRISEKPPTDQSYMYFWTKIDAKDAPTSTTSATAASSSSATTTTM